MSEEPATLRIALWGASGRMGEAVLRQIAAEPSLRLVAAVVGPASPWRGRPVAERFPGMAPGLGFVVGGECPSADVVLDFSGAGGFAEALAAALGLGAAFVGGSTGLAAGFERSLEEAAARIPVLWSPNFSLAVCVLESLVERAAEALPEFDLELWELHHRGKRDAPSGTALRLAEAAARGLRRGGGECAIRSSRAGPRQPGEIGVAVSRGGDAVGEHRVLLLGAGERLELAHQAGERTVFARGALRAARWLAGRPPGRYRLAQVLGLGP